MKRELGLVAVFFLAVVVAVAADTFGVTDALKAELGLASAQAAPARGENEDLDARVAMLVEERLLAQRSSAPATDGQEAAVAALRGEVDRQKERARALQIKVEELEKRIAATPTAAAAPAVDLSALDPAALANRGFVEQVVKDLRVREQAEAEAERERRRQEVRQRQADTLRERAAQSDQRIAEMIPRLSERMGLDEQAQQAVINVLQERQRRLNDIEIQRLEGTLDDAAARQLRDQVREETNALLKDSLTEDQVNMLSRVAERMGDGGGGDNPMDRLRERFAGGEQGGPAGGAQPFGGRGGRGGR